MKSLTIEDFSISLCPENTICWRQQQRKNLAFYSKMSGSILCCCRLFIVYNHLNNKVLIMKQKKYEEVQLQLLKVVREKT